MITERDKKLIEEILNLKVFVRLFWKLAYGKLRDTTSAVGATSDMLVLRGLYLEAAIAEQNFWLLHDSFHKEAVNA